MLIWLHANLRSKCLCGNYILHLGKHEVSIFGENLYFSFKAAPFSSKYKFYYIILSLYFYGRCTSYYNLSRSLPEGAFDTRTFCPDFLFVFCLSAIAFIEPRDYRVFFVIQKKNAPCAFFFYQTSILISKINFLPASSATIPFFSASASTGTVSSAPCHGSMQI